MKDIYPISVFVGPNNAGKSNFIKALSFYKDLLLDLDDHNSKFYRVNDRFHQLTSNKPSTISIRYKFDDSNLSRHPLEINHFILFDREGIFDREGFSLRKNDREEIRVIKKENFKSYVQRKELVSDFLFDTTSGYRTTSSEGTFEDINASKHAPFFWRDKDDDPGISIYNEIKKYVRSWTFIPADRLTKIAEREKILRDQLSSKRKVSNMLVDEICGFTGVTDINLMGTEDEITSYIHDGPGISVKLANLGSGFQQIYTMYPEFFKELVDKTVFFIEEPEVHLHPLLQRKLLQVFIKRSETNQFFLTTHSTIFCQYQENRIKPYLVKKEDYSTSIKPLEKEEIHEIKSALGHVNTDLFGYNAVLFVEGDSEENTIPLLANNLGIDIVSDGIRVINSKGYGNMRQIENIIDLLNDTATDVYALFDNHAADQRELNTIKGRLNKDNYIELSKEFEDSFNGGILVDALQDILQEDNYTLSGSDVQTIRDKLTLPDSKAFKVLQREYYQRTQTPDKFSKVSLGEFIAKVLAKKKQYVGQSKPEDIITRIHESVKKQMNF